MAKSKKSYGEQMKQAAKKQALYNPPGVCPKCAADMHHPDGSVYDICPSCQMVAPWAEPVPPTTRECPSCGLMVAKGKAVQTSAVGMAMCPHCQEFAPLSYWMTGVDEDEAAAHAAEQAHNALADIEYFKAKLAAAVGVPAEFLKDYQPTPGMTVEVALKESKEAFAAIKAKLNQHTNATGPGPDEPPTGISAALLQAMADEAPPELKVSTEQDVISILTANSVKDMQEAEDQATLQALNAVFEVKTKPPKEESYQALSQTWGLGTAHKHEKGHKVVFNSKGAKCSQCDWQAQLVLPSVPCSTTSGPSST
jgi:Zn-finger nucleic acid-binding protein